MTLQRFLIIAGVMVTSLVRSVVAQVPPTLVAMDQGASIIALPKVVIDGTRDTVIQISNVSNFQVTARCFYSDPSGANTEFPIRLLKQQPLLWVASQGQLPANAPTGRVSNLIPATAAAFQGEVLCVQTDDSGAPINANSLTGQATLTDKGSGDVAKYHAIGFIGDPNSPASGNVLDLGSGGPYSACPQTWLLDHFADGASDSIIGPGSAVHTDLTVVPCSHDLANETLQSLVVQFAVTNQFEQRFSASMRVSGRLDAALAAINTVFTRPTLGTDYAQTTINTAPGTGGGMLVVAQEFHDSGPPTSVVSSAAMNPHAQGAQAALDHISLPQTVAPPPRTVVFSGVTPGAGLSAITTGPDGNLWFTESFANQIGTISPTGTIEEFAVPTNNAAPASITAASDGNLWFSESGANQIGRISTDGSVLKEFAIGAPAAGVTGGPDGNVWFTEPTTTSIGRITPDGATVNEFPLPAQAPQPTSMTSGPDGNLWFTQNGRVVVPDAIGRITPDGATVTEFTLPAGSSPDSITVGPDGNLWFTESGFNQIGRITPAGAISEFAALATPTSIASVSDGNLWFTTVRSFLSPQCVLGRITPAGAVTAFFHACGSDLVNGADIRRAITAGPDGNVWFLTPQPEGIVRFAP